MTSYAARQYRDFTPLSTNLHMYDKEVQHHKKDDKNLGVDPKVTERVAKPKRHHSK